MCWNWFSLEVVTLPCQNLACNSPICRKRKTMIKLTKFCTLHYMFVKVAPLVHTENWNQLFAFITIGHQALPRLLSQ